MMKESDALEQVLTLLGHAKIPVKYLDPTDDSAIDIVWALVHKLREEGK